MGKAGLPNPIFARVLCLAPQQPLLFYGNPAANSACTLLAQAQVAFSFGLQYLPIGTAGKKKNRSGYADLHLRSCNSRKTGGVSITKPPHLEETQSTVSYSCNNAPAPCTPSPGPGSGFLLRPSCTTQCFFRRFPQGKPDPHQSQGAREPRARARESFPAAQQSTCTRQGGHTAQGAPVLKKGHPSRAQGQPDNGYSQDDEDGSGALPGHPP